MSTQIPHSDSRILFIGDSVTDCGRSRQNDAELGNGFPAFIAAWATAANPGLRLNFLNRGISGNRIRDLRSRWEVDCLALKPDVISILIGINDTWRRFDSNDPTSTEDFERDYRALLDSAIDRGTQHLILCEPFVLPIPEDRRTWRFDLDPRIHAVRRLAIDYQATLLPLDGVFAQAAAQSGNPAIWTADGVHPTQSGHALIAQTWLKAVGLQGK